MRTPKAGTTRRHESRLATNGKLVAADDESLDLVPVLVGKRMVGAVSRPGLVGALAATSAPPIERSDADILADMKTHITGEVWISKPGPTVETWDGVVRLWGLVGGEAEKAALVTTARSIPGCRAVEDHLVVGTPIHRYQEMILISPCR